MIWILEMSIIWLSREKKNSWGNFLMRNFTSVAHPHESIITQRKATEKRMRFYFMTHNDHPRETWCQVPLDKHRWQVMARTGSISLNWINPFIFFFLKKLNFPRKRPRGDQIPCKTIITGGKKMQCIVTNVMFKRWDQFADNDASRLRRLYHSCQISGTSWK